MLKAFVAALTIVGENVCAFKIPPIRNIVKKLVDFDLEYQNS